MIKTECEECDWVGRIKAIVSGKIAGANEEMEGESTVINKLPRRRAA